MVGAGIVGLSAAWFLQESNVQVTVLDRGDVGAGSSCGNAGWIAPGLVSPLPEPAALKYGLRAALSPRGPVYAPALPSLRFLSFMRSFIANSTVARWRAGMAALVPFAGHALSAYEALLSGGVDADVCEARPLLACYRSASQRGPLLEELLAARRFGAAVDFEPITGDQARQLEPMLADAVTAGIRVEGQRYLNPPAFVAALSRSVQKRGGAIRTGTPVTECRSSGSGAVVTTSAGDMTCDAVLLAAGAWLSDLARHAGVRQQVQAGRGYSFAVPVSRPTGIPLYFPAARLACLPLPGGYLRVAGVMEFQKPDGRLHARRVEAMTRSARGFLTGLDVGRRQDVWVGARPCTADGLPLIGRTRSPHVFVAGGHGMWGVTLGPATGRLAAELIVSGSAPAELAAFDPLRGPR